MKKTVSFLLMTVLCVTVFSLFGYGFLSIATPLFAVGCGFMLFLCYFVDRENLLGSIILLFYFVGLYAVSRPLLIAGYNESGMVFLEWFLTRGDEAVSATNYLVVLGLSCITFFGITVYYFTLVRYRINILTIVSMMPCVLYAKVVAEVDDNYLVVIALLNVLAAIFHYRETSAGAEKDRGLILSFFSDRLEEGRPLVKSALVFTLAVILIGALIPRQKDAKYYDRFEDLFLMRGQKDVEAETDLSLLNDVSGDADGYQATNPRRLFILKGDRPPYLKRHNFDYYDYETDHWYKDKDFEGMMASQSYPETPQLEAEVGRLLDALVLADALSPGLLSRYGLDGHAMALEKDRVNDELHSLLIYPIDFRPQYFLGASRQVSLFGARVPSQRYTIYYYPDKITGLRLAEKRLAQIDLTTSEKLLQEASEVLLANLDDPSCAAARRSLDYHYARTSEAIVYRNAMAEENKKIPESVRALSDQITEGLTYDWEKALALQTYFHKGGFTYDLEYDAPDDSVEYFLGEGKTGTCSDFASAYVLMARAAGLSVRYAEGFKYEDSTREGYYYIRETGSHAYPEVYIPLTGWCTFEPTISAEEKPGFFERLGINIKMDYGLIHTIVITAVIIASAGVVIKILWPVISWLFFHISLLFTPAPERPVRRYRRFVKKLAARADDRVEALTPRELLAWYADRWPKRKLRLAHLEKLVDSLEAALYR